MKFRKTKHVPQATREARWIRLEGRRLPGVDTATHAWLSDRGSLTRSVIAACPRRFHVDLLRQSHAAALPSEAALLDAGPARATLVREVRLHCGRQAWVFARTLIPMNAMQGPVRALTQLGRRPLGEVLFSDPTTQRICVEIARITPRHRLFERATGHLRRRPKVIWGRRTLFAYGGERILVNELFLPSIPARKS